MDEPTPPGDLSPEAHEFMARQMASMEQNLDFFLAHYLLPITTYVPDVAASRATSPRVVVGVGEESGGQLANETALALVERLETPAVTFPGDHVAMVTYPEEFSEQLPEVFRAR